jgi:hypothetical protein
VNLCRTCGFDFASVAAFDAHRVGKHGPGEYSGSLGKWTPEQGRRCQTAGELLAQGWEQNERRRWHKPRGGQRNEAASVADSRPTEPHEPWAKEKHRPDRRGGSQREVQNRNAAVRCCVACGGLLDNVRPQARFCSNGCRQRAYRRRRDQIQGASSERKR